MSNSSEEPLSDDDMTTGDTPAPRRPRPPTRTALTRTAPTPTARTAATRTAPTPTAPTATVGLDRRRQHRRRRHRRRRRGRRPTATVSPLSALDLLSGDAQTFLAKVWATRVHLHQADPERLVGLLSLDDVDHLLTETAIRTPAVRLAQDGSVLPESRFTRPGDRWPASRSPAWSTRGRVLAAVRRRRHRRPPGAAPLLAAAARAGRGARARARPPVPGQRLPHATRVAGLRGALRQPRRVRLPDPRAQAVGGPHRRTGRRRAARAGPVDVPADRHPARRPRAGRRVAPRDPRHQPADLARAGRAARSARCWPTCPTTHLPAGYLDDPSRARRRARAAGSTHVADAVRRIDADAAAAAEVERFLTSPRRPAPRRAARRARGPRPRPTTPGSRRRPGDPCVLVDRRRAGLRRAARRPHARRTGAAAGRPSSEVRAADDARPGRPRRPPRPARAGWCCAAGWSGRACSRSSGDRDPGSAAPSPASLRSDEPGRDRLDGARLPARRAPRRLGRRRPARRPAPGRAQAGAAARRRRDGVRVNLVRRHRPRRPGSRASGCSRRTPDPHRPWLETADARPRPTSCSTSTSPRSAPGGRPAWMPSAETAASRCARTVGTTRAAPSADGRSPPRSTAAHPDETWEVSHIGGDRFAGNLLVLPHGLYYGRLDPLAAIAVAGRPPAPATSTSTTCAAARRTRCRCRPPRSRCAAQLGETRLDAVRLVARRGTRDTWHTRFEVGPGPVAGGRAHDGRRRRPPPAHCPPRARTGSPPPVPPSTGSPLTRSPDAGLDRTRSMSGHDDSLDGRCRRS